MAWWMRPPPSRRCASTLAPSSGPSRWSSGTRTVVDDVIVIARFGLILDAGSFAARRTCCSYTSRRGCRPPRPAVNHFSPVMTHSSPSRTARLEQVRSDLPCGSVIEYADQISWFSMGSSQRSSVARCRTPRASPCCRCRGGGREHLRRRRIPPQDLVQQPELQLPVAGAAEFLVEEDGPQALRLDLVRRPLTKALIFGSRERTAYGRRTRAARSPPGRTPQPNRASSGTEDR